MIALVTGASAGIGRHFAFALARRGYGVVLVARSAERLEQVAVELRERFGVMALPICLDLSEAPAPRALYERLQSERIQIDLLVNNAGFGSVGRFFEIPLERELAMIRLNISALVELTGLVLPSMLARGAGEIINVSSVIASHPSPGFAVYAASKAFVTSFSAALAVELNGTGVYVQALHPGSTATNFQAVAGSTSKTPGGQQTAQEVVEQSLKGREKRRRVVVSGLVNRLAFPVFSALPVDVAARVSGRLLNRSARAGVVTHKPTQAQDLSD